LEVKNSFIKKLILKYFEKRNLNIEKIILFGSRASNNHSKYSDWDILIIIKEQLTTEEKREIIRELRKDFAHHLIPADIIIKNIDEIEYYKNFIGSVTREALKEGKIL